MEYRNGGLATHLGKGMAFSVDAAAGVEVQGSTIASIGDSAAAGLTIKAKGTGTLTVGDASNSVNIEGATTLMDAVTIQAVPITVTDGVGIELLRIDADYSTNLFIGKNAGNANTPLSATEGRQNTFLGSAAGQNNTTGYATTSVGYNAGYSNTTGITNTNLGYQSGYFNVSGGGNTNVGVDAGAANTASDNIFIGFHAGGSFTTSITGAQNVMIGNESVIAGTSLANNSALGYRAGRSLTSGINNVLLGSLSGFGLTEGNGNVLIGKEAGTAVTTGTDNVYIGFRAGFTAQTTTFNNTGVGYLSLFGVTSGTQNTGCGSGSGNSLTTGTFNTFLGYNAGNNASQLVSASNSMALGNGSYTSASNQVVIGNASVTDVICGSVTAAAQLRAASVRGVAVTYANRPGTPVEGMLVAITDSNTATWGATIAGGGANHVLGYYNGTNWTVAAA